MSISNYYRSPIRMAGLNSGMDTESIVNSLVKLDQMKIDRVHKNRTTSQWKLDAYKGINTKLQDFRSKYLSVLSPDNIFSASTYRAYKASYRENDYFTVGTGSGVMPGNYKVQGTKAASYASVKGTSNSAKAAEVSSDANIAKVKTEVSSVALTDLATGTTATGSTLLKDVKGNGANAAFQFESGKVSFMINGETFALNENSTLDDLVNAVKAKKDDVGLANVSLAPGGELSFESEVGKTLTFNNVIGGIFTGESGLSKGKQQQTSVTKNTTLSQLETELGISVLSGGSLSFKINGETYTFDGSKSIDYILKEINEDPNNLHTGSVNEAKIYFDEATMKFTVRGTNAQPEVKLENVTGKMFGTDSVTGMGEVTASTPSYINGNTRIGDLGMKMGVDVEFDNDGNFMFSINDKHFMFHKDQTLSEMVNAVNNSDVGVNIMFSEITNTFQFSSKVMGADRQVKLENVTNGALPIYNAFGTGGAGGLFGVEAKTYNGTNAAIKINDEWIEKETNNFTIDGMNFTITGDLAENTEEFQLTFSQDIDTVVEKMDNFIKAYNDMINEFYGMLTEKKERKFEPLTEEERAAMSDKDIEKWEEKAKAGILRNDPTLRSLLADFRSGIWAAVGDTGGSAFNIGISTTTYNSKEGGGLSGEIQLDKETFRKALEEDPDRVAQIMTNMSYSKDKTQKFNESGFVTRISNLIGTFGTETRNGVIKQTTQQITDYDNKIEDLTIKMYKQQERYWAQFTALEKAMASMNSQSEWLQQQLSALG